MRSLTLTLACATALVLAGCANTWNGVKQDTKNASQVTGQTIEKAGEKIKDMSR